MYIIVFNYNLADTQITKTNMFDQSISKEVYSEESKSKFYNNGESISPHNKHLPNKIYKDEDSKYIINL